MSAYLVKSHHTYSILMLNQIFYNSRYITPKRVKSLWGPSPRYCVCRQHAFFEEMSLWWRAVGNLVSDLTGLRFES